jgi:coenzyme PQQ biosynthesis protein PqqD
MAKDSTGDIAKPRFSAKVRLRFDRRTGRYLLLYPETGLELNRSATEVAHRCTGEWTVNEMVTDLAHKYPEMSPVNILRDVLIFLRSLADRGLIQGFK